MTKAKTLAPPARHIASLLCLTASLVFAQAPSTPKLEFEVASVRQNKSNDKPHSNFSLDGGNVYSTVEKDAVFLPQGTLFSATNQPLWRYIVFAYNLSGTQELALRFGMFKGLTSNVPSWVNTERFNIEARAEGTPTKEQMRRMMQALLADRFKMVVHTETREVPVLALLPATPGKTGPHLQPHPASDTCTGSEAPPDLPPVCGVLAHLPPTAPGRLRFGGRNVTLKLLATSLPTQTGMATLPQPVMDETGMSGTYDLSLEWAPERSPDAATDSPEISGPTFRDALQSQLGLMLVARKGPVELLVIDQIEQPSAN